MGAVRIIFRAELRRRWRSWLALVMLIAVVGGVVVAATAAGRRTATAFPRFVAAHGYDVTLFNYSSLPGLVRLPGVSSVTADMNPISDTATCACRHSDLESGDFNMNDLSPGALGRVVKLASGRMPVQSAPDEVVVSFTLERDYGVHIGTVIHASFYSAARETGDHRRRVPRTGTGHGRAPRGGDRCHRVGVSHR